MNQIALTEFEARIFEELRKNGKQTMQMIAEKLGEKRVEPRVSRA